MRTDRILLSAALAMLGMGAAAAEAATEIQWWHAMGGRNSEKVNEIAAGFNAGRRASTTVTPVFKGTYTETVTAAIAAFRAGEQPHIVQVFEVGTATMMAAEGAIYPVYQLMADTGEPFDPERLPARGRGLLHHARRPDALDALQQLDPGPMVQQDRVREGRARPRGAHQDLARARRGRPRRPRLPAIPAASPRLGSPGSRSRTNERLAQDEPIGTLANGFEGLGHRARVQPERCRATATSPTWPTGRRSKILVHGGRTNQAGRPSSISARMRDVHQVLGRLRRHQTQQRQGLRVRGRHAALLRRRSRARRRTRSSAAPRCGCCRATPPEDYKGVAKFFTYLSSPEVQADWHQTTGYLPITTAAYELTKQQGFYKEHPGTDTAIKQITLNPPTANSKGLRFGNFVQIRDIINEELEAVWNGSKSAKDALDDAVARGNQLLREFEDANS